MQKCSFDQKLCRRNELLGHPVHFVYPYVVMWLFLLVFAAIISMLFFPLFFSLRAARRHAVDIMVNDPFSDLPFVW